MNEIADSNLTLARDGASTVSKPGAADTRATSLVGTGGFDIDKRMATMGSKELRPLNLKSKPLEERR